MNSLLIYLCAFFVLLKLVSANQLSNCGDWVSFKDEKCYKIINRTQLLNFDDAKNTCYQLEGSSLASIRSQDEQDFLFNLLNNVNNIVNDVWLGIEFRDNSYKWTDSTALNYTNWANGNPINSSGYDCVQIVLTDPYNGQWSNKPCDKRNVFVCEKMQNWMFSYLQKIVMEIRETDADIYEQLDRAKSELLATKTELQNEIAKSTPPGLIAYFSSSNAPTGWLKANGQSVSRTTYANLFATIGTHFGSGDGNTTFTLPDLRGEFIRSWSDSRNVDKERVFGSFQWGSSIPFPSYINGIFSVAPASGMHQNKDFSGITFDDGFVVDIPSGATLDGLTFPSNTILYIDTTKQGTTTKWTVLKGARPRNIALLACIKY